VGGGAGGLANEQKKAAPDKRAKKAGEKAAKKKDQPKANKGGAFPATELTVSVLDIRVGKIAEAWEYESSDNSTARRLTLVRTHLERLPRDCGLSKNWTRYKCDVLVLCNLKARSLGGFPSHGMVVCAFDADHTDVEFAAPPMGAKMVSG